MPTAKYLHFNKSSLGRISWVMSHADRHMSWKLVIVVSKGMPTAKYLHFNKSSLGRILWVMSHADCHKVKANLSTLSFVGYDRSQRMGLHANTRLKCTYTHHTDRRIHANRLMTEQRQHTQVKQSLCGNTAWQQIEQSQPT